MCRFKKVISSVLFALLFSASFSSLAVAVNRGVKGEQSTSVLKHLHPALCPFLAIFAHSAGKKLVEDGGIMGLLVGGVFEVATLGLLGVTIVSAVKSIIGVDQLSPQEKS